jgi:hypothetical protein
MIISGPDGVTHINVYSQGETHLGRWLSNFTKSPITIPGEGDFISIEGYWFWLLTEDERFRALHGFQAKRLGKILKAGHKFVDDFENKIKKAIDIKLKSNLNLCKILCDSDLPLCHYYVYGDKKIDAGYEWIIEHIEERRKLLREYFKK